METVFRSSFLLALTCSKQICFPPDTDSFLCVKEWGWSIWGPVPGGRGSLRIREAGALGGGTPPPVRAAAGPFGACGAKASAPRMRIPANFRFRASQPPFLQESLLFLPPYICCKSFPVVSHKQRGASYSPSLFAR